MLNKSIDFKKNKIKQIDFSQLYFQKIYMKNNYIFISFIMPKPININNEEDIVLHNVPLNQFINNQIIINFDTCGCVNNLVCMCVNIKDHCPFDSARITCIVRFTIRKKIGN